MILTRFADDRARLQQWNHDDSLRWLQDRQQAYARLWAALDAWDEVVTKAMAGRRIDALTGELREFHWPEWQIPEQAARAAQGLVELMAPESVRAAARYAIMRRRSVRVLYLTEESASMDEMDAALVQTFKGTLALRDAMRKDLGLAAGGEPVTARPSSADITSTD